MEKARGFWIIAVLIGFAPLAMAVLPWDFAPEFSEYSRLTRLHSIAIPLIELTIVLVAMQAGFSLRATCRSISKPVAWILSTVFATLMATTALNAIDPFSAAIGMTKIFILTLFLAVMLDGAKRLGAVWVRGLWAAIGIGTLIYSASWITWVVTTAPSGDEWSKRLPGVANARHLGFFAIAAIGAAIATLLAPAPRSSARQYLGVAIFLAINGWTIAFVTGSRGATICAFVAFAMALAFAWREWQKLAIVFLVSISAAVGIANMVRIDSAEYGIERILRGGNSSENGAYDPASGRTEIWRGTIEKIREKLVLGWGVDQFASSGPEKTLGMRHPHNFVLQSLFSGGFVLVALQLALAILMLRQLDWRNLAGIRVAGLATATAIFVFAQHDGALYFSYPIMIFIIALVTLFTPQPPAPATDRSD